MMVISCFVVIAGDFDGESVDALVESGDHGVVDYFCCCCL